jgi:hypothetical protein
MAKKNKMGTIFPKEIQKRIHGVHDDKIQVGYEKHEARRAEGEKWTDENGKEWEVKNGIVMSVPKFQDARVPLFCPKCKGIMGKKSKDMDVYYKFGFCFDCLIERDIQMVNDGTMENYAKNYVRSKKLGYYTDMKEEIEEYLKSLEGKTHLEYVNEQGQIEKWEGDVNKMREFWEKELEFVNKELDKLGEE